MDVVAFAELTGYLLAAFQFTPLRLVGIMGGGITPLALLVFLVFIPPVGTALFVAELGVLYKGEQLVWVAVSDDGPDWMQRPLKWIGRTQSWVFVVEPVRPNQSIAIPVDRIESIRFVEMSGVTRE